MNKKIKWTCVCCGGQYSSRDWKKHIESKKHIKMYNTSKFCFIHKDLFDVCVRKLLPIHLRRVENKNCGWRVVISREHIKTKKEAEDVATKFLTKEK